MERSGDTTSHATRLILAAPQAHQERKADSAAVLVQLAEGYSAASSDAMRPDVSRPRILASPCWTDACTLTFPIPVCYTRSNTKPTCAGKHMRGFRTVVYPAVPLF